MAQRVHRDQSAGLNPLFLRLGLAAAGLTVIIIGGALLLRNKPSTQQPAIIVQAAPVKPAETVPPPVAATPAVSTPSFVVPVASTPPAPVPARIEPPKATVETTKPAVPVALAPTTAPVTTKPEPVKPAAQPTAAPAKLEPRAINFIESLRVAGIRASAADSKVLMNDRVYRIGSIVEHEMGLKLTGITSSSLTFEDDHGGSYTRTF